MFVNSPWTTTGFFCFCSSPYPSLSARKKMKTIVLFMMLCQLSISFANWTESCDHYKYRQDSSEPQPGMHILCAKATGNGQINISLLKDGHEEYIFEYNSDFGDTINLLRKVHDVIGTSNGRSLDMWETYDIDGSILYSIDRIVYEETAFIFTNGHWIWPGVRPGFEHKTADGMVLKTLSLRPLVFKVSNFLTHEECDYIQEVSLPHMRPSGTSKMDKDVDLPDTTWRTSTTYFLPSKNDTMKRIDRRTAKLTKSSIHQQEYCQVLRYNEGQKYDQHTDYFDPKYYTKDPATLANIKNGEKNRLITVLWYLTTVTDGGHTIFPLSFGSKPKNSSDCSSETALKVAPVKGDVIVFYSLSADGSLDSFSVHGACPVGKDQTKWAANKWIWTEDAGFL